MTLQLLAHRPATEIDAADPSSVLAHLPVPPLVLQGAAGFEDLFARTVADEWGNGWVAESPSLTYGVDGTAGWMNSLTGGDSAVGSQYLVLTEWPLAAAVDMVLTTEHAGTDYVSLTAESDTVIVATAELDGDGGSLYLETEADSGSVAVTVDVTSPFRIEIGLVGGMVVARAYNTSGAVPGWQLSYAATTLVVDGIRIGHSNFGSGETECILSVDRVTVGGVSFALLAHRVTVSLVGITDTFTRTVADGFGTSDAGEVWSKTGPGYLSVDGSTGLMRASSDGSYYYVEAAYPAAMEIGGEFDMTIELRMNHAPDPGTPNSGGSMEYLALYPGAGWWELGRDEDAGSAPYVLASLPGSPDTTVHHSVDYTAPFKVRLAVAVGGVVSLWIWQASDPMPGTATVVKTYASFAFSEIPILAAQQAVSAPEFQVVVDNLNIVAP